MVKHHPLHHRAGRRGRPHEFGAQGGRRVAQPQGQQARAGGQQPQDAFFTEGRPPMGGL